MLSHFSNGVMVTRSTAFAPFAYTMLYIRPALLFLHILWKHLRCA